MRSLRLAVVALALGCSSATSVDIDGVSARAQSGEITITNFTPAPVYTFVIGRGFAASADWMPCTNPAQCEGIAPMASASVTYPSVTIPAAEQEAIVYWWHLVPDDAQGFKPDSMRAGVVRLR